MRRSFPLAAVLLLLARPHLPLGAQAPRTRDSAGVRIVDNPARAAAAAVFRLGEAPIVDIGGLQQNPDEEIGAGGMVARLGDGRIVMTQKTHLKFFDARGKFLRAVGRAGEGPGEFRAISGTFCVSRGDTLLVTDGVNLRLTVLDGQGKAVRSVPLKPSLTMQSCFADGSVLMADKDRTRISRDSILENLSAIRTDGTPVHAFGMQLDPNPFVRPVQWAASGNFLHIADSRSGEVRVFSLDGKLVRIIRSADPHGVAPPKDAGPIAYEMNADGSRTTLIGPPTALPAFGRVIVDPTGRVWMEDAGKVRGWTVFAPDGRLLGRLAMGTAPAAEARRIVGFGANDVAVQRTDGDGATHITWFPLLPVR